MIAAWSAFTMVMVALLLVATQRKSQLGAWLTKPFASLGFIACAWSAGAMQSDYGMAVLIALVFGALGDVLLIPESKKTFLLGLVAFLIGHLGFVVAFFVRGVDRIAMAGALVVVVIVGWPIARWLLPHVQGKMRGPVLAYILVITVMVAAAFGCTVVDGKWLILVGAVAFYGSDISVATDKFVRPAFVNRLWGLPLYYGAQLILASTVP